MPVYEYRCPQCAEITSVVRTVAELEQTIPCAHCAATAERILSRPAVHRSNASKLERLDPKYDRMVDQAMATTQNAEPDRILRKMSPISKGTPDA